MNRSVKLTFALMLFVFSNIVASSTMADKIREIVVHGNQRIETPTVKEYLGFKEGDEFSLEGESEAIKHLYATTLFEDISINFSQGRLNVMVKETPFVSKVSFVGNTKVKTPMLANEVSTVAGESLRKAKLRADVEKIKEIYKRSGRFSIDVKAKVEQKSNNTVQVIFEIMEGPKLILRNSDR